MLPEYFAIVAAVVACIGELKYLYETARGTVQPNRVTWFLWSVFPLITFAAQRAQGVNGLSWATFVAGAVSVLILAASFLNKKAYWKTAPIDYVCMVAAFAGLGLWAITDTPNFAILFSIVADFAAGLPTVLKAYKHPETESWTAYAIAGAGYGLALLSVHLWTFENYAFALYLLVNNFLIAGLALRGIELHRSRKARP